MSNDSMPHGIPGDDRERAAQDRIWEHYQNEGRQGFAGADARQRFLAAKIHRGKKALDIGIGAGLFEEAALQRGIDVYALDPSERAIRSLQQRLNLGDDRARVGYGQAIPFPDGSFDAVVVSEVLEHLSDDVLTMTLSEIRRVLVAGGEVIGTVPANEILEANLIVCPHCGELFHRWGHLQSFDVSRMASLLNSTFSVEEVAIRQFVSWTTLNWKGKLEAVARGLLSSVGVRTGNLNIFFRARKSHRG